MKESTRWTVLVVLNLLVLALVTAAAGVFWLRRPGRADAEGLRRERSYANALKDNELYAQAIEGYKAILSKYKMDGEAEANLSYTIASLYGEKLHDNTNALAWYLRAKETASGKDLRSEVNRRIVSCLEKLGRSLDAEHVLKAATNPANQPVEDRSAVVALIGDRKITLADLDREIQKLPPRHQETLAGPKEKLEFLKDYVAQELMVSTARRSGFDRDPKLREMVEDAEKLLLAQRLYDEEVKQKVRITDSDLQLYYQAHQDDYREPGKEGEPGKVKPFAEVRQIVARDVTRLKEKEIYARLIARMTSAEKVVIFDNAVLNPSGGDKK
jgi:tetratricopeptide (TPR) repeat protein